MVKSKHWRQRRRKSGWAGNCMKYNSKVDLVYKAILDGVKKGDYLPGDRIVISRVAKENGCEILSLRESFLALDDMKAYYSKDGMHPNEAGYALIRGDFEKYFASAAGII